MSRRYYLTVGVNFLSRELASEISSEMEERYEVIGDEVFHWFYNEDGTVDIHGQFMTDIGGGKTEKQEVVDITEMIWGILREYREVRITMVCLAADKVYRLHKVVFDDFVKQGGLDEPSEEEED